MGILGAQIVGVGKATEGVRDVTNSEIVKMLLDREPEIRSWLRTDHACEWWFSDENEPTRMRLGAEFQKLNNRELHFPNLEDRELLWQSLLRDRMIVTSDEWVRDHTGIEVRQFAREGVATSDLAVEAAENALRVSGVPREKVDGLFLATVSPDHNQTPPTVAIIAEKLGIPCNKGGLKNIAYLDGMVACSSFVAVLAQAYSQVRCGTCSNALVIGADVMETTMSPYSRNLWPILASGGGALFLQAAENGDSFRAKDFFGHLDGSLANLIITPAGGSRRATTPEMIFNPFDQQHLMLMDGPSLRKRAVRKLVPLPDFSNWRETVLPCALERAGYAASNPEEFRAALNANDLILLHQANGIIGADIEKRLREFGYTGLFFNNIERHGNTTSAAVPILLCEAWEAGILEPEMLAWIIVFGGGFTIYTVRLRWTLRAMPIAV